MSTFGGHFAKKNPIYKIEIHINIKTFQDKHEIDRMTLTMNVELPDNFSPELKHLLESLLQVNKTVLYLLDIYFNQFINLCFL